MRFPTASAPWSADAKLLGIAVVLYALLSTAMSLASPAFLEADGVTHFLYSRFAFEVPAYFADVWARPVRMLIHAVPAELFGLHGVRAASLACVLGCAAITAQIARECNWSHPALAGFFVLAQPLLFLHSFSELTEAPFALLAAAAFLLMLRRNWAAFALACGALPAARPEGMAFVALACVMLVLHRRTRWLPLVALPAILWNTAGWWLSGNEAGAWHRWLYDHLPYSSNSLYPAGPIWRFLGVLPAVVSPLVLPAVLIGTIGVLRSSGTVQPFTRLARVKLPDAWLIAFIPWGMLTVHSVLHAAGRMSSSGEPRYLLAASPFWALLAAYGWMMIARRFELRRPLAWAAVAALIPIVANFAYGVVPLRPQPDARLAREIVAWYRDSPVHTSHPNLSATNPLVLYEADRMPQASTPEMVAARPAGTIFVYDSLYASYNADARMRVSPEHFDRAGWIRVPTSFGLPGQTWIIFITPDPAP